MIDFTHCNIRCNGLRKEKILLALLAAIGLPKAVCSRHSLVEGGL